MTILLDDFLPYQLSTASNAVSDLIASEYKSRFGLKIPEWRVMAVLGTRGASTQRHLVEATLMDKVTVNRAVKTLVDRALLDRNTGRDLYGQIMPAAQAMDKKIMAVLSEEEKAELSAMLAKIKESADTIARA